MEYVIYVILKPLHLITQAFGLDIKSFYDGNKTVMDLVTIDWNLRLDLVQFGLGFF